MSESSCDPLGRHTKQGNGSEHDPDELWPCIINRGRGPEIAGTRITVYNVMNYLDEGYPVDEIARDLEIEEDQVRAALDYIEVHRAELEFKYREILEYSKQPNPSIAGTGRAPSLDELRQRFMGRRREDVQGERENA